VRRPFLLVLLIALGLAVWLLLGRSVEDDGDVSGPNAATVGEAAPEAARLEGLAGAAERAEPAPEAGSAEEPVAWAVVGRVLGAGRHPAAGVEVALWVKAGRRTTGTTDADGRFRLLPSSMPPDAWTEILVVAEDAEGRRAYVNRGSGPGQDEDLDVGTLVLAAGEDLDVVVEGEAGPLAGAVVEVRGGGFIRQGFVTSAVTNAEGRAHFAHLPSESLEVIAKAEGYARTVGFAGLPRLDPEPLRLVLVRPRTVEVVVVDSPDERPVPGVEMALLDHYGIARGSFDVGFEPPFEVPPTDANGRTRIEGLGRAPTLHLGILARGHASIRRLHATEGFRTTWTHLVPIPPDEDIVRIVLPAGRRVRWPVQAGEVPVPADGTPLALRRDIGWGVPPGVEKGVVEAGYVVVEGLLPAPPVRVFAVTPDGLLAFLRVEAGATEGPPVSFVHGRTLEIVARLSDGNPAAKRSMTVLDARHSWTTWVRADEDGVARLDGLPAEEIEIRVPGASEGAVAADLRAGDARVEVEFPGSPDPAEGHPVRVHVLCAGEARLPDEYGLQGDMLGLYAQIEAEDPEHAVLEARWCAGEYGPKDGGALYLSAPGYVTCRRSVAVGVEELTFELEPAGCLLYTVLYPKIDDLRLRVHGQLQRWDEDARDWRRWEWVMRHQRMLEPPLWGECHLVDQVRPGRFRAVAIPTGQVSEEVTVEAGGPIARLTLDARGEGKVEGRVTGPPGADLAGAVVFVEDPAHPEADREVKVVDDGRFELPWTAGSGGLWLTARHPLLRPHAERGRVHLKSASDAVRLELSYGGIAEALIEVEPVDGKRPPPPRSPRVRLYRPGAEDRPPVVTLPARIDVEEDGAWRLRFAGYEADRWTVWADLSGRRAPLCIPDAPLDELDPDLGDLTLGRGSTVHVVFEDGSEKAPAILLLRAESVGGPEHGRYEALEDTREISVTGLGPGRYRVRGGPITADDTIPEDLDEVIEVDGRSTVERRVRVQR